MRREARIPVLAVVLAVVAATASGAARGTQVADIRATINMSAKHQRIDGFGVTWRVWSDPHLSNQGAPATVVPVSAQKAILRTLYGTLGLTRARPYLDPGTQPTPGGSFDFRRTDAQAALIKQARGFGLKTVFPGPVYLETWILQGKQDAGSYVDWAMAVLERLRRDGVRVPYYSPLNEPQVDGDFPPSWMHDVVLLLGQRMRRAGLATKLVIPDDENPADAYRRSVAVLQDPRARQYVGALAYHVYKWNTANTAEIVRMRNLALRYKLPLWMTEFSSPGYNDWNSSFDWALRMHTLLTDGDVNAVDYLWGFFGSWDRPHTMLSIEFENGQFRSYAPTPIYWITGQYSRFVRPGYVRVGSTASSSQVLVSAYTDRRRLVTVVLNPSSTTQTVRVAVSGGKLAATVQPVRSSATEHWKNLRALAVRGGSFSAILPPQSITSFVSDLRR